MDLHAKKRIEIIIETPALGRITGLLDDLGVPGYTVLPVLAGSGESGPWTRDGLVSSAGGMATIICILDEGDLAKFMDDVFAMVERQIGIINVSDCAVVRGEKFDSH